MDLSFKDIWNWKQMGMEEKVWLHQKNWVILNFCVSCNIDDAPNIFLNVMFLQHITMKLAEDL